MSKKRTISSVDREVENDFRYLAPALEKGLDVLELLSRAPHPMAVSDIIGDLGRSHGELFRTIQVLKYRGYLEQDAGNQSYRLSDLLFSLGVQQARSRNLVEVALPLMRQLSIDIGQSCHLAMHSLGDMVVVARMESGEQLGFSVRVGYRKRLVEAASGIVLYAFQPEDVRRRWEELFDPPLAEAELERFRAHADTVRARQVELTPSQFVAEVTDISAPVMRGGAAAAALTVPFLKKLQVGTSCSTAARQVRCTADQIAEQLVESDSRL